MQLKTKVVGAAGIAALVTAGGFAFTASTTVPTSKAAYGEGEISAPGDITNLVFGYSTNGKIDSVSFKVGADITGGAYQARVGFGTNGANHQCDIGTYTDSKTTVTCSTLAEDVAGATSTNILVGQTTVP